MRSITIYFIKKIIINNERVSRGVCNRCVYLQHFSLSDFIYRGKYLNPCYFKLRDIEFFEYQRKFTSYWDKNASNISGRLLEFWNKGVYETAALAWTTERRDWSLEWPITFRDYVTSFWRHNASDAMPRFGTGWPVYLDLGYIVIDFISVMLVWNLLLHL